MTLFHDSAKPSAPRALRVPFFLALAYAGACAPAFILQLPEPSPLTAVSFGLLLWLLFASGRTTPPLRCSVIAAAAALFYGAACVLFRYNELGAGEEGLFSLNTLWLSVCCFCLFFTVLRPLLFCWSRSAGNPLAPAGRQCAALFWLCFALLLLCWLPMYLMYFPGRVGADTVDQMRDIAGGHYSARHPFGHTMALQTLLYAGKLLFGTPNGGVALNCVVQMLLYAFVCSRCVVTLYQFGAKRWFLVLSLLFFGLDPNNMYRSQMLMKDSPFSIMLLLFILSLWRLLALRRRGTPFRALGADLALLTLSMAGACLFRVSVVYAFLPFTLVMLFALKKEYRPIKYACVSVCAAGLAYSLALIPALGVEKAPLLESFPIAVQQVGRVLADGGDVTEEDRALLSGLLDVDEIAAFYEPWSADYIKYEVMHRGNIGYFEEHLSEFFRLWLRMGLRNPRLYLYAAIDETSGYWTPLYPSPRPHYTISDDMKDYQADNPWGYYADPILSDKGIQLVRAWMVNAEKLPVLSMTSRIGTASWLWVAALAAAAVRRQRFGLLLHIPMAFLFLSLLLFSPYNCEYRYLYPMFLSLPLYFSVSLFGDGSKRIEDMGNERQSGA